MSYVSSAVCFALKLPSHLPSSLRRLVYTFSAYLALEAGDSTHHRISIKGKKLVVIEGL